MKRWLQFTNVDIGRFYLTDSILAVLEKDVFLKSSDPQWDSLRGLNLSNKVNLYGLRKQLDSARYFYKIANATTKNAYIRSENHLYRSRVEFMDLQYDRAFEYYDKALSIAKSHNYRRLEMMILTDMLLSYETSGTISYARETLDVLKSYEPGIPNTFQFHITLAEAGILRQEGKFKEAVEILENIDTVKLVKRTYNKVNLWNKLSLSYLQNNQLDKALKMAKKAYNKDTEYAKYSPVKDWLFADIYLRKGNISEAINYLEKGEKSPYANLHTKKNYARLNYQIQKKLNRPEEALRHYENYVMLKDSVNLLETNKKLLINDYKIKKDKGLLELEIANKTQQLASEKEKQFFVILLITVTAVLILIILIIYFFRKKKSFQLNLALQHEQEISQLKNTFIENLTHEFRTPISIIIGYSNLILTNSLNPQKITKYSKLLTASGNNLIGSLNDFLSFLSIGKKETTVQSFSSRNIGEVVLETVESYEIIAQNNKIHLHYESNLLINDHQLTFEYDHLKKIICNLLSNAVKFSPSFSSIYISSVMKENELMITVKDEGIGIAAEDQPKIFERFYQTQTKSMQGGFGIGLSLVKNILDRWGGHIHLFSEQGKGSTFEVSIPVSVESEELKRISTDQKTIVTIVELSKKEIEKSKCASTLPKILIVDDNKQMATFLEEVLSPFVVCSVAYNGKQALREIENQQFDLILSDLKMPIMDGFEFKSELNRFNNYKTTPFLMMSSLPIDYKIQERVSFGIEEFIMKPFSEVEIISRVRLLLKERVLEGTLVNLGNLPKVELKTDFSDLIAKINTIILENIENPKFNVKMLAKLCNYSERQLSQILRENGQMSPVKIILEIKLLKAYELLKNKALQTLNEVMYAVGINSRSYFNQKFEGRFGIKPGQIIKDVVISKVPPIGK
ncbi:MAG: response regulator [Flavobacteriaceae bacterium]